MAYGLRQGLPNLAGGGAVRDGQASVGLVGAYRLAQEAAQVAGAAVYLEDQVHRTLGGEHEQLHFVEPTAELPGGCDELELLAEGQPTPEAMGQLLVLRF